MAADVENSPENLARELRRWRLTAGLLLVVILVLGSFSAYLARSIDGEYLRLLDRSVPVLNELRLLGHDALSTQRAVLSGLLGQAEADRKNAIARAQQFDEMGSALRQTLSTRQVFANDAAGYALLDRKGDAYDSTVSEIVALLKQNRNEEADAIRQAKARPALDEYLEQIDVAARYVEAHSQTERDEISSSARNRSAIVFGVASLPLVVGTLLGAIVLGLVFAMVVLFRRLGPEEGP